MIFNELCTITTNGKKFSLSLFTIGTALQKVQEAKDALNYKDPERVSQVYSIDSK